MRSRRRLALALAALALAAAATVAVRPLLPGLTGWALVRLARLYGLAPFTLEVRRVAWGELEASGIRLGGAGEVGVAAVRIAWSTGGILCGRLETIAVDGLRVRAAWRDGRLEVVPLEALRAGRTGDAGWPSLPVARLAVRDARLAVELPAGSLEAHLDGEARFDERGGLASLAGTARLEPLEPWVPASIAASADVVGGGFLGLHGSARLTSSDGRLLVALDAPADSGDARLDVAVRDGSVRGVAAGIELAARLVAAPDGAAVAVRLEGELRGGVASLAPGVRNAIGIPTLPAGPFSLGLRPAAERPLLRLRHGPEGAEREAAAVVDLRAAGSAAVRAEFEASQGGDGVSLTIRHGEADLPGLRVAARQMEGALDWSRDGAGALPAGSLRVGALTSLATPPWVQPLALDARIARRGAQAELHAEAHDASGALRVAAEGQLGLDAATGTLRLRATPLRFGDAVRPGRLFPALRRWVTGGSGEVTAEARVGWSAGQRNFEASALLRDLALEGPGRRVEGLNGSLALTGWPPETGGRARAQFSRAVADVELTDGAVEVAIESPRRLDVERARARVLGGEVRARGRLALDAPRPLLPVELDGIDIAVLLDAVGVAGLSGTGRAGGTVAAVLAPAGIALEDGRFAAAGDGWIRYRPPNQPPPDAAHPQGLHLARAALHNFHYDALSGTLAGEVDGELRLALRLRGANPELYDGYPILLEVNVKGPFLGLLRSSRAVMSVPEPLERRLRERLAP